MKTFGFFLKQATSVAFAFGVCLATCHGQDDLDVDGLGELQFKSSVFPGQYAGQLWPGRGVDLTPEQFELRNQILKEMMEVIPSFEGTPAQLSERYYNRISDILEPDQRVRLQQVVAREFFRLEGQQRPEDFTHPNVFWTHRDLRSALNLQQFQMDQLQRALNQWRHNEPDRGKLQSELDSLFEQWQQRLEECLLPRQQQLYGDTTGNSFDFGSMLEGLGRFLSVGGEPLFVRRDRVTHGVSGFIPPLAPLLSTEQRLDGVLSWHGTADLLLFDAVKNELKLQEPQVFELEKWRERVYRERPMPTELTIGFRERGVLFEVETERPRAEPNSLPEAKPSREPDSWNEQQAKMLVKILDIKQRERLRQIKNQFVLRMGWEKVPLTFPDWPSYLELSESQRESWQEIHQKMEKRYWELVNAHAESVQKHSEKLSGMNAVLNDTQRAKLQLIFGPFANDR